MLIIWDFYIFVIKKGKEFETRLKEKKPGNLSDELKTALGMPLGHVSSKTLMYLLSLVLNRREVGYILILYQTFIDS